MTEENLIQDYVDGNLDSSARESFEQRFLNSEENRERVRFARALRRYVDENNEPPQKKPGFFSALTAFFTAPLPIAATVLLIAGAAGFFVWKSYQKSPDDEILASLNKAFKTNRPTEARIAGFDYAPKTEGTRGGKKEENFDLLLAKTRAAGAVLKDESAENLYQLGRVFLAENDYDKAIEQFEKALRKNNAIARIHNDLAVALMEKGKQRDEGNLELFARANEEIDKAIQLDKNLAEAYFNRGLAVELLKLPNQAKEAWENYLKLDSTSKWADEARRHLQNLEQNKPTSKTKEEILQEFLTARQMGDHEQAWQILSRNREMITGKLIPQQLAFLFVAARSDRDREKTGEYLEALVYTGKLEEEKTGDAFWNELAKYYSKVSDDKIIYLQQGQESVLETFEFVKNNKYEAAITSIEAAQSAFLKAENGVEAKLLDFLYGYCKNRLNLVYESNEQLFQLAEICRVKNYKWLHSQILTWLAINSVSSKEFSKSIVYDKEALRLAEETDDLLTKQKAYSQLAESYSFVGQYDRALDYAQRILELNKLPETSLRQKWRSLKEITKVFYSAKLFQTAILFGKEALAVGLAQPEEKTFAYASYIDLGLILGSVGNLDEAFQNIEKGQELAQTFTDEALKEKSLAYTNLQLAHLNRQAKNYSQAAENYNQSIEFYDSQEFQVDSYDAHRGLLLNFLAENNDAAFQDELPKILKIFNEYRVKIVEEQNRNRFFDNEQNVYDIATEFKFERADFAEAFDYSEESRARSLLDLQNSIFKITNDDDKPEIKFSQNVVEPVGLAEIQAEMPENTQIVEFAVLPDKVLIWLVTKENLSTAGSEISSDELDVKVSRYLETISKKNDSAEQFQLAAELYRILIDPIKQKLDPNKEICLIPDKFLFHLPFAALFSDKYLVEDYKLFYAPSANIFLNCWKKAGQFKDNKNETLLSIGNPKFDRKKYGALSDLPSAKEESVELKEFYPDSIIFTDEKATKSAVRENLKKSDVIHFAGHYVVDEKSPLLSGFILAGTEKEDTKLANFEFIGEKLSKVRLIVLSACQTGIEQYYQGEGMIGATRSFLATGVPLVIASQWEVDSKVTKILMIDFHRARKQRDFSTVEALRKAQLDMLRSDDFKSPYYWASFAAFGGSAPF
ncbi:MAG: CHAT domain-containing protein [Acidobacteria bacterium]|nr:CHAT domain-containing protein [Acidobacteriota bacterium]